MKRKMDTATSAAFAIRGNGGNLNVRVNGYSHPTAGDYWDGNWVASEIEIRVDGFRGTLNTELRTDEFARFLAEIEQAYETLEGVARFEAMEEALTFGVEINRRGTCQIVGNLHDVGRFRADLWFNFESDQTYLAEALEGLRGIVSRYPVRGSPSD